MEAKTGKFGPFHSHKMADGSWCNGKTARASYPYPPTVAQATSERSGNREQQRAWGKSKQLQIRLQGLIQAMIASGQADFNKTDHSNLIKLAATLSHQIEEFADKQVGFDRAADQLLRRC